MDMLQSEDNHGSVLLSSGEGEAALLGKVHVELTPSHVFKDHKQTLVILESIL